MRRVFIVGDSISIQYGPYLKKMIEPLFLYDRKRGGEQALTDLDNPVGANGGDSGMVLEYLKREWEKGNRYDFLLVNCGLHDIKRQLHTGEVQTTLPRYRDNLDKIVLLSQKIARSFVWIRTTDAIEDLHNSETAYFHRFHQDVVDYNATADELMGAYGVSVIDLYSFTRIYGTSAYCDHVHYTEEVRRLQAAYIAGFLHSHSSNVLSDSH